MELTLFSILGALALASAVATISCRSPIRCALSLVVCLFSVAGLYVLLQAHFLAAMQLLVYAGAIMVLFVFVVMLLNLSPERVDKAKVTFLAAVSGLATLFITAKVARILMSFSPGSQPAVPGNVPAPDFGSVGTVGRLLFKQFLLPFELVSLLLLVAVVGAVVIARKRFWREGQ